MSNKTEILSHHKIQQILNRISFQILEEHANESEIVFIGIAGQGTILAKRLMELVEKHGNVKVSYFEMAFDKNQPLNGFNFAAEKSDIDGKSVLLIDDVLNSGKVLMYAAKYALDYTPKSIHTATLVNRLHRKFPIRADYVGLTLATTLKEHITVSLGTQDVAFLE